jgi:dTMP kinase
MDRGLFIVIEGLDGSGSTTQSYELLRLLRASGYAAFQTNQPSNGPVGMLIRLALTRRLVGGNFQLHAVDELPLSGQSSVDNHTLALLYAADRMDHVTTQILPSLERGRHVICDRYLMSALAYQGVHLPMDWLLQINRHAPAPDLTIYLDVPAAEARRRMMLTRWTKDLFEEEELQSRIRENFVRLAEARLPALGTIVTVDGTDSIKNVTASVQSLALGTLQGMMAHPR